MIVKSAEYVGLVNCPNCPLLGGEVPEFSILPDLTMANPWLLKHCGAVNARRRVRPMYHTVDTMYTVIVHYVRT